MIAKILIIDDNKTILASVSATLRAAGFEVTTRDQAVGTTVALMREHPDVALVDVNMPLLEGGDLVRSIRKRDTLRDIIVLLYSAQPEDELRRLAHECGAEGYISKSVRPDELVAAVSRWAEKRARRAETALGGDKITGLAQTAPEGGDVP